MVNFTKPNLTKDELETVIESMGESAVIIDQHGLVIRANKLALNLLGYKEKELMGQRFMSKAKILNVDKKSIDKINRPMVRAILSGRPAYDYVYYETRDKKTIPLFVSAAPIINNAKPIGLILVFRDISMEEAVDKMKSEFIALASHQLRTPLSSIKTYSHMLLDGYMGEIDEQKKPALETIVAATNRMNELIGTLLHITRLESGTIVIEKKPVDMIQIIQEILDEMEIFTKYKSIKLKLVVKCKESTKIRSDGPLIQEVMSNLVSNAIKYSKQDGIVTITVTALKDKVTVTIKDNGLGIPAEAKKQIFSKFFRATNVTRIETNGTGLGLYLVKGLVDELGGHISFTSQEDKGSTFRFSLPRKFKPI